MGSLPESGTVMQVEMRGLFHRVKRDAACEKEMNAKKGAIWIM
jgi:hypothetical protein